jgi:hypothetical protein
MSVMPAPKIIDLDADLGLDGGEPLHTKKIKLLGREWTVICDLNSFAMSEIMAGDTGAISTFIRNLIAEDERDDFAKALAGQKNLSGEKLGQLLGKLIEVASGRPTELPSPSSRTATKRTSTPKSRAR